MAIPAKAVAFPSSADPYDHVEWVAECAGKILETGEKIASYTLLLDSSAIALGVSIDSGAPNAPAMTDTDTSIQFWLSVDPAQRENVAFDAGVKVAVKISIVTDSTPPRTRQRTWVATLEQQ